jgi:hypothetical protein
MSGEAEGPQRPELPPLLPQGLAARLPTKASSQARYLGRPQDRVALMTDSVLSALRTRAAIRPRWFRPSWQAGYEAGLRQAHQEAVAQFVAEDCVWPTRPQAAKDCSPTEGDS